MKNSTLWISVLTLMATACRYDNSIGPFIADEETETGTTTMSADSTASSTGGMGLDTGSVDSGSDTGMVSETGTTTDEASTGAVAVCRNVEEELGSALGAPVTMGSTSGEDEDLSQTCAGGGAVDHVLSFIAPATATFVFDTSGSGYDTSLAIYSGCDARTEIACDDDAGSSLWSEITLDLALGEEIMISINGFSGGTGEWVLNIAQN